MLFERGRSAQGFNLNCRFGHMIETQANGGAQPRKLFFLKPEHPAISPS